MCVFRFHDACLFSNMIKSLLPSYARVTLVQFKNMSCRMPLSLKTLARHSASCCVYTTFMPLHNHARIFLSMEFPQIWC